MATEALTCDRDQDESLVISKRDNDPGAQLALYVLQLLQSYKYTVPTFTVFHERLWHGVCQVLDDDDHSTVVDVLFKEDCVPQLLPPFSVNVSKFCCVQVADIRAQIPLKDIRLYKEKVLVVWECDETTDTTGQNHRLVTVIEDEPLPLANSTDDDSDDFEEPPSSAATLHPHTVVFKCIGATRDTQSQRVLYQAKSKLDSGWSVPVRMRPEPTNIHDARAVIFECRLDDKWQKIGYVVKDILEEVHFAIDNNLVMEVKFQWVKYITEWTRSP